MNIDRLVKKVKVGRGETVRVEDGIQNMSFFDLNVHVVPLSALSGSVKFYIGKTIAKTIIYSGNSDIGVFAPTPPDYPEIFPPTVSYSYLDSALGEAGHVTGRSMLVSVEISNEGIEPVMVEVHFVRKYRA